MEKLGALSKRVLRDRYLYVMLIPFIAWYVVFEYLPMYGLQIAFKDYKLFKGIAESPWVGWQHFELFITGEYFWRTIKNTLMISFYSLIFAFPAPIILALLVNEVKNAVFKKTVQTLTYLPHFVSIVVVAGIVTSFLAPSSGIVNSIIEKLGGDSIYFLTEADYFRTIFIGSNIWKEVGFNAIIYFAALSAINPDLYEAAVIDGASKWRQVWHVTIPGIASTIIILLILKIGEFMSVGYEFIILLYQPATYETADVVSTYVYRSGIQSGRYDYATAVGMFNSIVSLILIYAANKTAQKISNTSLW